MGKKYFIIASVVILFGVLFLVVGLRSEESQNSGLAFLDSLDALNKEQENGIVRQAAAAGAFYPADKEELKNQVGQFLDEVETEQETGDITALILPHAGYQFSGQTAAHGFKTLIGRDIDTIIIIGNSHKERFEGISVFPSGFYKTPLGEVEVDSDLAGALITEHERIFFKQTAHKSEHSIEVQLPFLQQTLQNFKIVPILFGNSSADDYKILSNALLKHINGKNILVIASSDLSHYPVYEKANYADKKTINGILTGEIVELEKIVEGLEKENIAEAVTFACGIDAVKTIMQVAGDMGAKEIKLLNYANSGDVEAGDRTRVVGYAAVGFFKPAAEKVELPVDAVENHLLNKEEQKQLLQIARRSVESVIKYGKMPSFKVEDESMNDNLGAFVTIKKYGQLRGCIGNFSPANKPLYQTVSAMAVAAATQDKRFSPVQEEELKELHYEVSVLSALRKIDSWQEIELHRHGVQITRGKRSGVFLPQVATENNWGIDRFMGELCRQKAGLEWDCWKKETTDIFVFTAQVFAEE